MYICPFLPVIALKQTSTIFIRDRYHLITGRYYSVGERTCTFLKQVDTL